MDDPVDRLNSSGGHLGVEVGQDPLPERTNGAGQMAKGPELAACGPTTPPPQFRFGYLAVGVGENGLESLPESSPDPVECAGDRGLDGALDALE